MSERLEEIKSLRDSEIVSSPGIKSSPLVGGKDIDWLIGRVEELENQNKYLKESEKYSRELANEILIDSQESLLKQNQRYREALEKLADHIDPYVSKIANEALEDNQ